jgi:hypothetical protein
VPREVWGTQRSPTLGARSARRPFTKKATTLALAARMGSRPYPRRRNSV